jgi:hypothetical protein
MSSGKTRFIAALFLFVVLCVTSGCAGPAAEVERPEKIVSKRIVVYDEETYRRLADLWEAYYRAFPSEDAYANWMYAARYAGRESYEDMLEKGLKKYSANPTLLYLAGILRHGKPENEEGRRYLERAVQLDPSYMDPWFALAVHHMERKDRERMDVALRNLLEGGWIADEVLDYSWNMLAALEEGAILITNGDNDTYPGWILQRILGFRPDVRIVNHSLLSTSWYPSHVIEEGVPRFITAGELSALRETMEGPYGDTLTVRIIEAAAREDRPVYFSLTLYPSQVIDRYAEKGRMLALSTLVTPVDIPYGELLANALDVWMDKYRTGGIDSWKVRFAKPGDAGRMLMLNYAANIEKLIGPLSEHAPEWRLAMFEWYRDHCLNVIPQEMADEIGTEWSRLQAIPEIQEWCRTEGYGR